MMPSSRRLALWRPTVDNDQQKRLHRLIAEQLGFSLDEVKPQGRLHEDLGCDSLDRVELAMAAEDEFEIELADRDIDALTTVESFETLVSRELAGRVSA
jgi:acyl carrier protein